MRNFLFALLVAAVPIGLYFPLVGAEAPGAGYVVDPGTRWLHLGMIAVSAALLFAAYRIRTGLAGPGLAAALAFAVFPATADAVATTFGLLTHGIVLATAAAIVLVSYTVRRAVPSEPRRLGSLALAAGLLIGYVGGASRGAPEYGAAALEPGLLRSVVTAVFAGECATFVARAEGPARGAKGLLVAGLAAALLVSAGFGQWRAATWSDPVAFWDRAVDEEPRNLAALGASAGVRAEAGDRDGAAARLRAFEDAASADRGHLGSEASRAGADGVARASTILLEGAAPADRETIEKALHAARKLDPDGVGVAVALAEMELARGDFVDALKSLPVAVKRDPGRADAWDALARARLAGGRVVEAVEAARTACGLRPSEKRYFVTFARALLAEGRGAEALRVLWEALGDRPPFDPFVARAFGDAEVSLARIAISDAKPGQARRMLGAGLKVDPRNAEAKEMLARLDRDMEAERKDAEKLLEPGPGGKVHPDNWIRYVVWLCRWGEYEKAEPHFRRMMRDLGGARVPYIYGAEFWESRGTVEGAEEAVKAYRQSVAIQSDFSEAWNRLWQCLRTLGRIDEAQRAAEQFLDYDRVHPDAAAAEEFLRKSAHPPR